jgi:hypothetical protein
MTEFVPRTYVGVPSRFETRARASAHHLAMRVLMAYLTLPHPWASRPPVLRAQTCAASPDGRQLHWDGVGVRIHFGGHLAQFVEAGGR